MNNKPIEEQLRATLDHPRFKLTPERHKELMEKLVQVYHCSKIAITIASFTAKEQGLDTNEAKQLVAEMSIDSLKAASHGAGFLSSPDEALELLALAANLIVAFEVDRGDGSVRAFGM